MKPNFHLIMKNILQVERDLIDSSNQSHDVVDMIADMQDLIDEAGFDELEEMEASQAFHENEFTDNEEIVAINEFLQSQIGNNVASPMEPESIQQLLVDSEHSNVDSEQPNVGGIVEDHPNYELESTSNGTVQSIDSTLEHERNKLKLKTKKKSRKANYKSLEPLKTNIQKIDLTSNKSLSSDEDELVALSKVNDPHFEQDQPIINIQNNNLSHNINEDRAAIKESQTSPTKSAISRDDEISVGHSKDSPATFDIIQPIKIESPSTSNQVIETTQPKTTAQNKEASTTSTKSSKITKASAKKVPNKRQAKHSNVTPKQESQLVQNDVTIQATSNNVILPMEVNIEHSDLDTAQQITSSSPKPTDDTRDPIEEEVTNHNAHNEDFVQTEQRNVIDEVADRNENVDQNINTSVEIIYQQNEEVVEEIVEFEPIQPEQIDNVTNDEGVNENLENISQAHIDENIQTSSQGDQDNVELTTESKPLQQNLSDMVHDTKRLIQVSTHFQLFW